LSASVFRYFAEMARDERGKIAGATVAQALIASPQTHAIAFTRLISAARAVASAAAPFLKPTIIEAGGNDAMIISASAPLEVAQVRLLQHFCYPGRPALRPNGYLCTRVGWTVSGVMQNARLH
jgi:hypothetical protein